MDWRKRVEQKMEEKGIVNRTDLCHYAGISAGSLNLAMRGNHDLKPATMRKVAEVLGTTEQWLLYGDSQVMPEQVPLCRTPDEVFQYTEVMTERDKKSLLNDESIPFMQLGGNTRAKEGMFAWFINQQDMGPLFEMGTMVVIDTCDISQVQFAQDTFAMAAVLKHANKPEVGFKDVFIHRLCRSGMDIYWECLHPHIPPIPWGPNKEKIKFIGRLIQYTVSL